MRCVIYHVIIEMLEFRRSLTHFIACQRWVKELFHVSNKLHQNIHHTEWYYVRENVLCSWSGVIRFIHCVSSVPFVCIIPLAMAQRCSSARNRHNIIVQHWSIFNTNAHNMHKFTCRVMCTTTSLIYKAPSRHRRKASRKNRTKPKRKSNAASDFCRFHIWCSCCCCCCCSAMQRSRLEPMVQLQPPR